jgi:hypothetical protein
MTPQAKALVYAIVGTLGFVCFLVVLVARRHSPAWARYSFVALALLALCYGTLGYVLEHYRASLPYQSRATLDHYRTLAAGVAIGIFAVLAASGQFKLRGESTR